MQGKHKGTVFSFYKLTTLSTQQNRALVSLVNLRISTDNCIDKSESLSSFIAITALMLQIIPYISRVGVYLRRRRNIVSPKENIVDAKHHIVYTARCNIVGEATSFTASAVYTSSLFTITYYFQSPKGKFSEE